jgi:putative oxidoreductase
VRRLYSTFAHGAPGVGLLLLRLAISIVSIDRGIVALLTSPSPASLVFYALLILLGALLLVGLWTPITAALAALSTLGEALVLSAPRLPCILVGVIAVAVALLGPGAWSLDAWLYGWKRIRIADPNREQDPPL